MRDVGLIIEIAEKRIAGTGAECICPLILIQVIGKSPARVGIITSPYMVVAEPAILILSAVAVALILGKCILDAR
ncbi:ethylene-insensitive protein 2-like [Gossypium australe]|uniref:Ethylene-insensitive protein 2-like n=1 Tax=Gossypium australe TaxID=47621 RepID=A0A5B6V4D4_9ROSI|nr:ethylene-insensitive protein 2-like [Gossypium australe]